MATTIAVSEGIRDQIKEFGSKGETYDQILSKILNKAKERQLQELLMDKTDSMLVKDALSKAKKKWSR